VHSLTSAGRSRQALPRASGFLILIQFGDRPER
jgi:hypothetical protein